MCGSSSYRDPWEPSKNPLRQLRRSRNTTFLNAPENKGELLRTPAVLPLPGLGTLEFLSALTKTANPNVFDNDAMRLVLKVMWRKISLFFLLDFVLFIGFFVSWCFLADSTASSTSSSLDDTKGWILTSLIALVLVLNTLFLVKELLQADWGRRPQHFRSWWNLFDFLCIVLVYSYVISTPASGGTGTGSVPLAVVTTLCLTVKLLSYLRGFSSTGWLVSVLAQNAYDVRGFVLVLFSILVGFTVAFRLLFGDIGGDCSMELDEKDDLVQYCGKDPYGTLSDSLLSTFELAILGAYDSAIFDKSRFSFLAVLTFVLAVTVVLVVALNALIAVLGDSYSRVQEHSTANRRKEKAELIVEYLSLIPARKRQMIESNSKYFHALLQADADGDLLVEEENWEGSLNSLKREIAEMNEENLELTQKLVGQMKKDLDEDIQNFRREVQSTLHDITVELKNLKQIHSAGSVTSNEENVAKAVKVVRTIEQPWVFWQKPASDSSTKIDTRGDEDDRPRALD